MKVKTLTLGSSGFPEVLAQIPQPPKRLFVAGAGLSAFMQQPRLAVVGSRKVSAYGKIVTTQLVRELAGQGIIIVSGLALGVDALAHRAALEAGGITVAVLPCGLDRIYPASHQQLAHRILQQGGALITEYPEKTPLYPANFIARNRIVAGLSGGLLITEAAARSGTMSTARFALDQGREVMAVPGNITSTTSAGTNNLIKSGATPVTEAADALHALGLEPLALKPPATSADPLEQQLLDLLAAGISDGAQLLATSRLEVTRFNQALTMLEITGKIRPLGNNQWAL